MQSRQAARRTSLGDLHRDNTSTSIVEVTVPSDIFRKAIEKERQVLGVVRSAGAVAAAAAAPDDDDDEHSPAAASPPTIDARGDDREGVRALMRGTFLTESVLREAVAPRAALADANTYIYALAKNIRSQQTAQEERDRKSSGARAAARKRSSSSAASSATGAKRAEQARANLRASLRDDARRIGGMLETLAPQIASAHMTRSQYVDKVFGREKLKSLKGEFRTDVVLLYGGNVGRYTRTMPLDTWRTTFLAWQKEHMFDTIDPRDPRALRDMLRSNLDRSSSAVRARPSKPSAKRRRSSGASTPSPAPTARGSSSSPEGGGADRPSTRGSSVMDDDINLLDRVPMYLRTDRPEYMLYRSRSRLDYMGDTRILPKTTSSRHASDVRSKRTIVRAAASPAPVPAASAAPAAADARKRPRTSVNSTAHSKRQASGADKLMARSATTLGFFSNPATPAASRPGSAVSTQQKARLSRSRSSFGVGRGHGVTTAGRPAFDRSNSATPFTRADSRLSSFVGGGSYTPAAATPAPGLFFAEHAVAIPPADASKAAGVSVPLNVRLKYETDEESINPFRPESYESRVTFLTEVTEDGVRAPLHIGSHGSPTRDSTFTTEWMPPSSPTGRPSPGYSMTGITGSPVVSSAHNDDMFARMYHRRAAEAAARQHRPLMKRLDTAMRISDANAILSNDSTSIKDRLELAVQHAESLGSADMAEQRRKRQCRGSVAQPLNFPIEEVITSRKRIDKVKRGNSYVTDMGSIPDQDALFPPVPFKRGRTRSIVGRPGMHAHTNSMRRDHSNRFLSMSNAQQNRLDTLMRSMQSKKESKLEAMHKKVEAEIVAVPTAAPATMASRIDDNARNLDDHAAADGNPPSSEADVTGARRRQDYTWLETLVDEDPRQQHASDSCASAATASGQNGGSPSRKSVNARSALKSRSKRQRIEESGRLVSTNVMNSRHGIPNEHILSTWKDRFARAKTELHTDLMDRLERRALDRRLVYRSREHLTNVATEAMRRAKEWTLYRLLSASPKPQSDGHDTDKTASGRHDGDDATARLQERVVVDTRAPIWTRRRRHLLRREERLVDSYIFWRKFTAFLDIINAPVSQIRMEIIEFVRRRLIGGAQVTQQMLYDLLDALGRRAMQGREVLRVMTFLAVALKADIKTLEKTLKKRGWLTEEARYFLTKAGEGTATPS